MKNINIQKVANVISIFLVFALALVPLLAGAQFRTPSGGPVGNVSNVTDLIMRFIQILLAVAGLIAVIFLIIGDCQQNLDESHNEVSHVRDISDRTATGCAELRSRQKRNQRQREYQKYRNYIGDFLDIYVFHLVSLVPAKAGIYINC